MKEGIMEVKEKKTWQDGDVTYEQTTFVCGCSETTTFHPRVGFCSNAVGTGSFEACCWEHSRD